MRVTSGSFKLILALAAALACTLLVFAANDYVLFLMNVCLVYMAAVAGFNVVLGYAGQPSFANAALFGVGAYATGLLTVHFHLPFPAAMVAAIALSGAVGWLIGIPSSRLRRQYFAIGTLVFAQLATYAELFGGNVTFGARGFDVPEPSIGPLKAAVPEEAFIATFLLVGFVLWMLYGALHSKFGRSYAAVRENELAAQAMGVDAYRATLQAFVLSACVTGFAGAMYAFLVRRVSPQSFTLEELLLQLVMVLVGGAGYFWGALASAVGLILLHYSLAGARGFEDIFFGTAIVLVVMWFPKGLSGALARIRPSWQDEMVVRASRPSGEKNVSVPSGPVRLRRSGDAAGALLDVRGLTVSFGGLLALDGVVFMLERGTIHSIIGPNGAGKSTFINTITGFVRPSAGRIVYKGRDITGLPPHRIQRCGIGRTFQKGGLFMELTALENVLVGLHSSIPTRLYEAMLWLDRSAERRATARALEVLASLGLERFAHTVVRHLSGGQRQLVELARLLVQEHELIILDEPMVGLSPVNRQLVTGVIRDLNQRGVTFLVVDHVLEVVTEISDQVTVLNFGQVVFRGRPSELSQSRETMEAYFGGKR